MTCSTYPERLVSDEVGMTINQQPKAVDASIRKASAAGNDMTQTPLLQQYRAAKERHPGMLMLFRVGGFYELFDQDAPVGRDDPP